MKKKRTITVDIEKKISAERANRLLRMITHTLQRDGLRANVDFGAYIQ